MIRRRACAGRHAQRQRRFHLPARNGPQAGAINLRLVGRVVDRQARRWPPATGWQRQAELAAADKTARKAAGAAACRESLRHKRPAASAAAPARTAGPARSPVPSSDGQRHRDAGQKNGHAGRLQQDRPALDDHLPGRIAAWPECPIPRAICPAATPAAPDRRSTSRSARRFLAAGRWPSSLASAASSAVAQRLVVRPHVGHVIAAANRLADLPSGRETGRDRTWRSADRRPWRRACRFPPRAGRRCWRRRRSVSIWPS